MVFAQLVIDLDRSEGLPDWRFFALVFILLFTLWWMYFGLGVHERRYAISRYRLLWIAAHYLLLIGVVGMTDVLTALAAAQQEGTIRIGITYLGVMTGLTLLGFAIFVVLIDGLGARAAAGLGALAVASIAYGAAVEATELHGLRLTAAVLVAALVAGALALAVATGPTEWRRALRLR